MKVLVVAEFYPRRRDPVLGIWAHRQALAARDAGADVRVCVLHRPIPPSAQARSPRAWLRAAAQPPTEDRDGLRVDYVPFVSPPRPRSYGAWGRWASPTLAAYLRTVPAQFPYDVVHAHNAVPAGDAVRRTRERRPLVVSCHGGDVLHTALRPGDGRAAVHDTYAAADLVLANSRGIERLCAAHGARRTRVVHLGADVPTGIPAPADEPTVVTTGHLVARKRHADVVRALWVLRDRRPDLRYRIVGDGPERGSIEALAARLGVADRVELLGQLPHEDALAATRTAHVFAMPSTDEAFGVAYVEAMAAGIPAIGCLGEPGPLEIAETGDGLALVAPGDVEELAEAIDHALDDPAAGAYARQTVLRSFTWERCGAATVAAYEAVLR